MTTNMATSSLMTKSLNMEANTPLRTKRPMTIAFNTAWMMKPRAGFGGSISVCYYYSSLSSF